MKLVILVVDDEEKILSLWVRAMRHRHEIILEPTGQGALDRLLSDDQIDVTFLDLMIPDITGAEILHQLRVHARSRLERVVISTGAIGIPGLAEMLADYVVPSTGQPLPLMTKPYGLAEIDSMLNRFVMNSSPKGPRSSSVGRWLPPKPTPPRQPPRPSKPDLEDDDGDADEVSKITQLANQHDPMALAIRDLRREAVEHRAITKSLEKHFDDDGDGKPTTGLVRQIAWDMHSIRASLKFLKVSIPLVGLLVPGLVWIIMAVNSTKAAPSAQPDVKAIAREVQRQMQESKP